MDDRTAIWRGTAQAVAAAVLFGLTTPLAKVWLAGIPPLQASGLLYTGSGVALGLYALGRRAAGRPSPESPLRRADLPYLAGAVAVGGVLAPALLLFGLSQASGTVASLLLNLETVFTILVAVLLGEAVGWRSAGGIAAILAGGALLAVDPARAGASTWLGAGAITLCCLCWGLDNNLTQRISGKDPVAIATAKSLVAGPVSLALAAVMAWVAAGPAASGARLAAEAVRLLPAVPGAFALGALGFGLSIALFVRSLRTLGAARTGTLFATAPFVGATAAIVFLREPPGWPILAAGAAMAAGVWLVSTDVHDHEHEHAVLEHEHLHAADEHHRHVHDGSEGPEPHSHWHRHEALRHGHPHAPDLHHRHRHGQR